MEFLPNEIILCILSKVPIMELGGLKCVCKSWKKMIIDNQTALIQLHRGSPSKSNSMNNLLLIMRDDRDSRDMFCTYLAECKTRGFRQKLLISNKVMGNFSFEIVGSCNGLLCLLDGITRSRIVVMNPLTNQSMWLPSLDLIKQHGELVVSCGFGYNLNTNSYKVIVILETRWRDESEAVMFDCETNNNWRSVGKIHHSFQSVPKAFNSGIFLNGRLHWITEQEIVSFDLIDGKFTSIRMPGHLFSRWFCDLIVFKGCLCIVKQLQFPIKVHLQIWVMKQYGVEASWEALVPCSQPIKPGGTTCVKALGEVENGQILLKTDETMLLYDPTSMKLKSLEYRRLPRGSISIIHYPTLDWPRF